MPTRIHEFRKGAERCIEWQDGDGMTARMDAVTCPECQRARAAADSCPCFSARYGRRCMGRRGHGGLHHSDHHGVLYVWTDATSPELAVDLLSGLQ